MCAPYIICLEWILSNFMGEKWRNIEQPRPVGSCLLFLDLVQSALRYNETSNIYLGNNEVELSIVDKLYFYYKETLIDFDYSFKIKRLKLKDDFSIRTIFKLHIQLSLLLRSEQKLLFLWDFIKVFFLHFIFSIKS